MSLLVRIKRKITLWFYDPRSDADNTLNWLVARYDGPFCHCEVQFSDRSAYAVYAHSCVTRTERNFSNPAYSSQVLWLSPEAEKAARAAAEAALGTPFSLLGMINCHTRLLRSAGQGVFCSELCVRVLQAAGLLGGVHAAHVSPSGLHRRLEEDFSAGARHAEERGSDAVGDRGAASLALDWNRKAGPTPRAAI